MKLIERAIALADTVQANLFTDTEDLTGSIIFVGDSINFTDEKKKLLHMLALASDEISIKPSVDTGMKNAIDIDGLAQIEFWFDFYARTELDCATE